MIQNINVHNFLTKASILLLCTVDFGASSHAKANNNYRQIVDEAWQIINKKFVSKNFNNQNWLQTRREFLSKDYATKKAAYEAIRTMFKKLDDPETRLLDSKVLDSVQKEVSGEFMGVGLIDFSVETDEKTKELKVVTAIADTPAALAGLQPNDIIQAIDNVSTKSLSHDEAMMRLRGKANTKVVLSIRRHGKTFDIPLQRKAISVQPVRTTLKHERGKTIGYIALNQFTPKISPQTRQAVKEFTKKNVDGFIIDIRNNPGGLLDASTEIASLFLNKEKVVSIQGRTGLEEIQASGSKLTNKPVVILVNHGTASASEVLAGALQDNRRAVIVGTATFGRARVHSLEQLSDRSMLLVAVGSLLTPNGRDIDTSGIQPDYVVEIPQSVLANWKPSDTATSKDNQFNQALAVLLQL